MSEDIYSRHSRRKRRKLNKQSENNRNFYIIIAVIAFVVLIGLYLTRNNWIPEIEKIGIYTGHSRNAKVDENGVLNNSGELATGNFPIMLSNSSDYQMNIMNQKLVILSDTDFEIYSSSGELLRTKSHNYSNVVLKSSANRSMIYESGGNKLCVESEKSTVFEKEIDSSIIFARISKEGYIAVVSTSDNYACSLTVYDNTGTPVYSKGSVDRIIEICFNNDSTGCRVTVMNANIGQIVSKAYEILFTEEDSVWTTENLETLCINSYSTSDNGFFIIGDTKCGYYNCNGLLLKGYIYKNSLIAGEFCADKSAMTFENEERRKTSLVLTGGIDENPVEVIIDKNLKCLCAEENYAYIMTDNQITAYDYSGKETANAPVADIYNSFLKSGDIIYLIGKSRIDKISFITN